MDYFLQQLINALAIGSLYALIALGYTMVYGVLRLINFAHGEVFMLGAFTGVYTASLLKGDRENQPFFLAFVGLLLAMAVCALIGWLIERFAYRPLRKSSRLAALITAIGVSLLILNLANIEWTILGHKFFGPTPAQYPNILLPFSETRTLSEHITFIQEVFGVRIIYKDILLIGVTAIVLLLLWYVVRFTRRGQAMRAVSQNYDAARLMGININATISFTFMLGSAMAAVGGVLYCIKNSQVQPTVGTLFGLKAFVAAVIGGIGNIPGAALGGLTLGILETIVAASGYSQYTDAAVFVVLILMLLVRPEGLFGKAVPEKV